MRGTAGREREAMNPSDLAIAAVTLTSLANTGALLLAARTFARQLRITAPPKEQAQQDAAAQPQPVSISDRRPA